VKVKRFSGARETQEDGASYGCFNLQTYCYLKRMYAEFSHGLYGFVIVSVRVWVFMRLATLFYVSLEAEKC
jgi:hypothetical protein